MSEKFRKPIFMCVFFFSQLRARRLSVAASGVKCGVGRFSSKAVWRGLERPKLMCINISKFMCKKIFRRRYVCQHCVWPSKLANIPPRYVFLIQVLDGNCILSHPLAKLANIPQGNKVAKHTPLKSGGGGADKHRPMKHRSLRVLGTRKRDTTAHHHPPPSTTNCKHNIKAKCLLK